MSAEPASCCAAIVDAPGAPFRLAEITLNGLQSDEVLVEVVAAGICHTDTSIRDSAVRTPKPVVLGHEGAGIVLAVGSAVERCKAGDRVVTSFASCGECSACSGGRPTYCSTGDQRNFGGRRVDQTTAYYEGGGGVGSHFFGQSVFSAKAVVHERSVVPVETEIPLELLAPLGCGIQTGAGAALNALKVGPGDIFLVIGSGSVGLSAVMAAKVVGAQVIVAIDLQASRLALAAELGATNTLHADVDGLAEKLRAIAPHGFTQVLDTTGRPASIVMGLELLAVGGVCGSVGMPHTPVEFSMKLLMSKGASLRGIIQGDSDPMTTIPELIALHQRDMFPFHRLVTYYSFADINNAVADMLSGAVIKPILLMPGHDQAARGRLSNWFEPRAR